MFIHIPQVALPQALSFFLPPHYFYITNFSPAAHTVQRNVRKNCQSRPECTGGIVSQLYPKKLNSRLNVSQIPFNSSRCNNALQLWLYPSYKYFGCSCIVTDNAKSYCLLFFCMCVSVWYILRNMLWLDVDIIYITLDYWGLSLSLTQSASLSSPSTHLLPITGNLF